MLLLDILDITAKKWLIGSYSCFEFKAAIGSFHNDFLSFCFALAAASLPSTNQLFSVRLFERITDLP
jgi:hypothetical protein